MSIAVLFSCASIAPGVHGLLDETAPLSPGFSLLFHMSHNASSSFAILATYAKLLGFSFAFVRQMTALAKSKLLIKFFPSRIMELSHSFRALFIGCLLGFILLFFNYRLRTQSNNAKADHYRHYLEATALICAFLAYIGIFVSYIAYKRQFHTLSKTYTSKLGMFGAVYGIFIFGAATISCVGFQDDHSLAIMTFVIFMMFQLLYYFLSGRFSQIYSSEEQAVLFIAYIMKANNFKRLAIKKATSHRMAGSPKRKPFNKQGTNATMEVTQCNTTESSTAIHTSHSAAAASVKYQPTMTHQEMLNESRSDRDEVVVSQRTKLLVDQAAQATGIMNNADDLKGSVAGPTGDSFQGPAPALGVKGREQSLLIKAALRGRQYLKSFLAPIVRGNSHRVLPFYHDNSNNNLSEEGSPSRRNSDSSDGSSNRSLLHHYMDMIPDEYRPRDLDFDEGIMETYQDALSQMHAISTKFKAHKQPAQVTVPLFEASTKDREIEQFSRVEGFDREASSSLVLKDFEHEEV
eukprot:gene33621-41483_t